MRESEKSNPSRRKPPGSLTSSRRSSEGFEGYTRRLTPRVTRNMPPIQRERARAPDQANRNQTRPGPLVALAFERYCRQLFASFYDDPDPASGAHSRQCAARRLFPLDGGRLFLSSQLSPSSRGPPSRDKGQQWQQGRQQRLQYATRGSPRAKSMIFCSPSPARRRDPEVDDLFQRMHSPGE